MTPAASLLDPSSNPALYVSSVLTLYVDLPDTPLRANLQDQRNARNWFDRGIALSVVETALLLASLRRLMRPRDVPPLQRIRSLAYFQPVIDELLKIYRGTGDNECQRGNGSRRTRRHGHARRRCPTVNLRPHDRGADGLLSDERRTRFDRAGSAGDASLGAIAPG